MITCVSDIFYAIVALFLFPTTAPSTSSCCCLLNRCVHSRLDHGCCGQLRQLAAQPHSLRLGRCQLAFHDLQLRARQLSHSHRSCVALGYLTCMRQLGIALRQLTLKCLDHRHLLTDDATDIERSVLLLLQLPCLRSLLCVRVRRQRRRALPSLSGSGGGGGASG
jgi:hypothetical protein